MKKLIKSYSGSFHVKDKREQKIIITSPAVKNNEILTKLYHCKK